MAFCAQVGPRLTRGFGGVLQRCYKWVQVLGILDVTLLIFLDFLRFQGEY
jgi:hypothetical protein